MLYGLDFDFLMLNTLMIIVLERSTYLAYETRIQNGLAVGVLVAYTLDLMIIWVRKFYGKRNIARHTLVNDEKFLIS